MRWPIVIVAAVAAITGAPGAASASPGDAAWDGAVFAGPTSPHPSSVVTNPAAMLLATPGIHLFIGGTGTLDQISIDDTSGTTMGAGGHIGIMRAWPGGSIAFVVGTPPPDETLAGEDALRYHTRGSRSRMVELGTLSAAYRLTSRIALGLAGTFTHRETVLRFARDTALENGRDAVRGIESDCGGMVCGMENPLATELWTIRVESDLWHVRGLELPALTLDDLKFAAGAMLTLPGDVRVGITYQRPWNMGRIDRAGTATVVSAPRDGGAVRTGDATLFDKQPQIIRVGARARALKRWDLIGEVRTRLLDVMNMDDVRTYGGDLAEGDVPAIYPRPRGFRWTAAVEAGLEEIDDGQVLRLGGRIGFDRGAVANEQMSARAPWGRQVQVGAGAQLRLGSRWVLQLVYSVAYQPPIDSDPNAFDPIDRLDCVDSGYDTELPACATVRSGFGAPSAAGTYDRWSHIGRVSLRLEVP